MLNKLFTRIYLSFFSLVYLSNALFIIRVGIGDHGGARFLLLPRLFIVFVGILEFTFYHSFPLNIIVSAIGFIQLAMEVFHLNNNFLALLTFVVAENHQAC